MSKQLTDEKIFLLRQEGKTFKDISILDGRSVNALSKRCSKYCHSIGIDKISVQGTIRHKIEEKTEASAEDIAQSLVKQRQQTMEASALIVQKALDILGGKGEYFGEGSANLNLLANVLAKLDTFLMNREATNPIQDSLKPDNLDAIAEGYGLKDYKR